MKKKEQKIPENDNRFSELSKDPRFNEMPKKDKRMKID